MPVSADNDPFLASSTRQHRPPPNSPVAPSRPPLNLPDLSLSKATKTVKETVENVKETSKERADVKHNPLWGHTAAPPKANANASAAHEGFGIGAAWRHAAEAAAHKGEGLVHEQEHKAVSTMEKRAVEKLLGKRANGAKVQFSKVFFYQFITAMALFPLAALSFAFFWMLPVLAVIPALIGLVAALHYSMPSRDRQGRSLEVCGMLPPLMVVVALICGSMIGVYGFEVYTAPYNAVALGTEYHNVLASTPGAAYADSGIIRFSDSSAVDPAMALGYKHWRTYCVAPVIDSGPEQASTISFWVVGLDCCGDRATFSCDDVGDGGTHASVRAAPDGFFERPQSEFMKAINMAAAVYGLQVDETPILLHWVKDPNGQKGAMIGHAFVLVFLGTILFALVVLTSFILASVMRSSAEEGLAETRGDRHSGLGSLLLPHFA